MRAIDRGLGCCSVCHKIVKLNSQERACCPRCGSEVYLRKPHSLQYSLAFALASIIFYIPANIYPMMRVDSFSGSESSTIIGGIVYFINSGSYLIAFVILVASVVVPFLKIAIILYLIYSVYMKRATNRLQKLKLYRLIELIGRWSMVDVYVVSIMIALVHFGAFSEIRAESGAIYFLLVVVFTMLSTISFDSRLIWDIKTSK